MFKLIILIAGILIAYWIITKYFSNKKVENKKELPYEKKPYLFDANSEFNLYKVLVELYGNKYYIFPQINYSHLIQPKKSNFQEERKYRSKIDRKSADFVFCDKEKIIPQLIIELDGYVHSFKSKQARDQFIDEITGISDLPILHLKTNNLSKDFVKSEIDTKLVNK
jgi:very-short-patch-repair endonuclease